MYCNHTVPLSGSFGIGLLLLYFRMITIATRMAKTMTKSAPDAEHVPATYTGIGQKCKMSEMYILVV